MEFKDLGLTPSLLKNISDTGYRTPTPIQQATIPLVLEGKDVLGCAQTGTGKTAAFALPILQRLQQQRSRRPDAKVIRSGVNTYAGKLTNRNVAAAHHYDFTDLTELI